MKLFSPAKLNLFLRVLHRRPDGYHELASLFQAIDLFDTLYFELQASDALTCSDLNLPTNSSNLVFKARELFRQKTGLKFGVHIHLEKKIPQEAGLGGGSSNAATTLWGLNQLLGCAVNSLVLQQWAAELGSDVPFFLSHGTAFCTGRGEHVQELAPLKNQFLWVIKPSQGTTTASVYAKLDAKLLLKRDPELYLKQFLAGEHCYFNDLEASACLVTPELAEMKQQLEAQGYAPVQLCGSGSSFFCGGQKTAPEIPDSSVYAVRYINRTADTWYKK